MVADPVDVHLLTGNAFHRHFDVFLTEVLLEEIPVQFVELGQLVSIRIFRLVVVCPDKRQVRMLHVQHHLMDGEEIRKRLMGITTVLFRIELGFDVPGVHDPEFIQCESQFIKPFHDEGNGAAADFIPASNGTESDTILT